MRKTISAIAAALAVALMPGLGLPAVAGAVKTPQAALPQVSASNVEVKREGSLVRVGMDLDLSGLEVNRNRAILIVPALVNGSDTVRLAPVGIYGNTRYVQQERLGKPLGGEGAVMYRSGSRALGIPVAYRAVTDYTPALEGAGLVLIADGHGCCNKLLDRAVGAPLAVLTTPEPEPFDLGSPMWMIPGTEQLQKRERMSKTRTLTGSAYIDFPVNQTVIYPDYRGNAEELAKIRKTMNVVFTDPDVTVNLITIKGYASPEGPYANNVRLAKGRTEALRDYVSEIYKLPLAVFGTSSEPEDWAGLRAAVDTLDIAHKSEILAIIDSDMKPDAKDDAIRNRYWPEYRWLLANVYPALRHSDYRIDYLVRDYEEPTVIEAVMERDATKLSAEEFYIAASAHEPGSPEFVGIYAMALQYYPDDPVANYNLALWALHNGDAAAAAERLAKVPDGPEKDWALEQLQRLRDHNAGK